MDNSTNRGSISQNILIIAGVTFAYIVTGYMGLMLAVPPGYATTIWPPSGIAVASVLLWGPMSLVGVFIGSNALNVLHSIEVWSLSNILQAQLIALPIAAGSTLQTWFARKLILRFTRYPNTFSSTKGIFIFSAIAGPVACVIAATVGVLTLFLNDVTGLSQLIKSWSVWWAGDTIGVLVFAPILIILLSSDVATSQRRKLIISASFLVSLTLAIGLFFWSKSAEGSRIKLGFREDVLVLNNKLSESLQSISVSLSALKGLYASSEHVNENEFKRFFAYLANANTQIDSAFWIQYVAKADRQAFEEEFGRNFGKYRKIWWFKDGQEISAGEQSSYFPITFNVSRTVKADILGYDPSSEQSRKRVMDKAMRTKIAQATAPSVLVKESRGELSTILFMPVFAKETLTENIKSPLLGFVACLFYSDILIERAMLANRNIVPVVHDLSSNETKLVYQSKQEYRTDFSLKRVVEFAGRRWQVTYFPTEKYLKSNFDSVSKWVLFGCMIIVWMVGIIALLVTGYEENIRNEVEEKTAQLRDALAKAEFASKAKSQFLASMSHELRTPLNSIIGFTTRLTRNKNKIDPARVESSLEIISRNSKQLLHLINDILDLSKIEAGKADILKESVDLRRLFIDIENQVSPMAEEKNLVFSQEIQGEISGFSADRKKLFRILNNIVVNAIKYTEKGSVVMSAYIHIQNQSRGVMFQVADTGIGISKEEVEDLFRPFTQLNSKIKDKVEGSGLGLSLVKEYVDLHGGHLSVDSEPEAGSIFKVWFPFDMTA